MANTDKLLNADPYAATEATETHRRGPERKPERPQTRSEYIEHVLAQIKAPTK